MRHQQTVPDSLYSLREVLRRAEEYGISELRRFRTEQRRALQCCSKPCYFSLKGKAVLTADAYTAGVRVSK